MEQNPWNGTVNFGPRHNYPSTNQEFGQIEVVPKPPKIVAMLVHKDRVIVAMENTVYWLDGDVLRPMSFGPQKATL